MFGYITPVREKMQDNEAALFRAFYCSICKCTGSEYGLVSRLATNYEITFFAILVSDFLSNECAIETGRCIANPFKKRVLLSRNPLVEAMCDINILLAYYKVIDNQNDEKKRGNSLAKRMLKKPFEKAKNRQKNIDEIIKSRYTALNSLEKAETVGIDIMSHEFASLLADVASAVCGDKMNDNMRALCYNIGKFIYLADALDDIEQDMKSGCYNPFLYAFGKSPTRQEFFRQNSAEISFVLNSTINRAIEAFNNLRFTQSYNVLQNIVHFGLRHKLNQILTSEKKLDKNLPEREFTKRIKKSKTD